MFEDLSRINSATTATAANTTATGSAATGHTAKRTPIAASAGQLPNLSHLVPATPTVTISQARVTSWAHSEPGGIGPWKRNDPTPVATSPAAIHLRSGRVHITQKPAMISAIVVNEFTGCARNPVPIASQSPAAPMNPR